MKTFLATVLLVVSNAMFGATFYFSTTGNDGNDGSSGSPWTKTRGLASLTNGNIIIAKDGEWTGPWALPSTFKSGPATLKAENKWKAVVKNSATYGLALYSAEQVVIDGICISNSAAQGIDTSTGSPDSQAPRSCMVTNCWIIKSGYNGINFTEHTSYSNIVACSLFESNAFLNLGTHMSHGMYLSGSNNVVHGNVSRYNMDGFGIQMYEGGAGKSENANIIRNNLTYGNGMYGLALWSANGNDGTNPGTNYVYGNTFLDGIQVAYGGAQVTNNILMPGPLSGGNGVNLSGSRFLLLTNFDYNLSTNTLYYSGTHDVVTSYNSIAFANTNNALYWLTSGSAARGVALTTVYAPVDFFGSSQSSIADIGFNQYSNAYAADTRDLSGVGANFWLGLTNAAPAAITNSIFGTVLRIGP